MALKTVAHEHTKEILEALGLKSFTRPFAGLIDSGDFGTVGTYVPIYPDEYKKLPPNLQRHVYLIAPGRYGLICFLPRTFEAPDGGKVAEVSTVFNAWGKMIKVAYKTDKGGEFETEHTIRQDKLLAYAKNKKLPVNTSVKITG
ncbi:MAG TPA: hypothetical protein DCG57_03815 [Candidatus Riflebacteria bacterium]|jgi:hypothetical protein|nr:MAG: hypothetical protein CVV41_20675 [Candidatus Riflebacteria bacterium HGW-Riflebacteria-1]HAE37748.1 hypothetical protein [Candidatus Riflebacteria bacterium]